MDTKAILHTKRKLNELAAQHNRLTTLCGFLLNEVNGLKKELSTIKSGDIPTTSFSNDNRKTMVNNSNQNSSNFSELKAEEILKQLSINNTDM
tara:strand:- start:48 stop:326 length:279 start_codon:yes stop_codon:yes gene_type:complete